MKRLIEIVVFFPVVALALPVLVDSALKGALLMAMILVAVRLLRGSSAALRHLVLTAAMLGLLALPLLSLTLPGWRVLPAWAETRLAKPAALQLMPEGASGLVIGSDFGGVERADRRDHATTPALPAEPDRVSESPRWLVSAVWIWLLGGALFGLRLALSRLALWRLGHDAQACSDRGQLAILDEMKSALQIRRPVELLIHPERAMPMTWGIFQTRLLLPAESLAWESGRLRAVLLHELAHVKRRDCLTQFLVQSTCALHWFNPLAWVAARRIAAERERACDDLVLNSGVRASDYAEHLLRIATGYEDQPVVSAAALAMARKSSLEGRLTNILSERIDRRTITRRVVIVVSCTLALLALPVAMMRAVAQDDAATGGGVPPEVEGSITRVNDDWGFVLVDLGRSDGLVVGDRLDVMRGGELIAELEAMSIKEETSVCEAIAPGQAKRAARLAAGDEVRLRDRREDGEPDGIAKLVREWARENALEPYLDLGMDEALQLEALLQGESADLQADDDREIKGTDEIELQLQRPRSALMDPLLMPKRPSPDSLHLPAWRSNSAWQSITPYELGSLPELEAKLGTLRIETKEPDPPAQSADKRLSREEPTNGLRAFRPAASRSYSSLHSDRTETLPYPAYGRSLTEPWAVVVEEEKKQEAAPQSREADPEGSSLTDPWGNPYTIEIVDDQTVGKVYKPDSHISKALADRLLEEKSEDWFTRKEDLLEMTRAEAKTRSGLVGHRVDLAKIEELGAPADDDLTGLADRYLSTYLTDPELWALGVQRETLQVQRQEMGKTFGAKHPKMLKFDDEIRSIETKIVVHGSQLANPNPDRDRTTESQFSKLAGQFEEKTKKREQLLASGLGPIHPSVVKVDKEIELVGQAILDLDKRLPAQQDLAPFAGVGIVLRSADDGGFLIMSLLDGAPAARSGQVRPNDRIVAFAEGPEAGGGEWIATENLSLEDFIKHLRGKAGDAVRLEIQREVDGKKSKRQITLVRELLKLSQGGEKAQGRQLPGTDLRPKLVAAEPEAGKATGDPILIPLKHADAAEAKEVIDGILRGSRRGRVIIDAETNSLIYIGDAATLKLVRSAVEWLEQ